MSTSRTAQPAASAPAVDQARTGLIQITVTGVLWGTTGVAVQLLHDSTGLSPVSIGFHRLAIAALVLLACTAGRLGTILATLRAAPVPPLLGLLAAAGSGLGYAVTTLISRQVSQRVAPMTLTTISTVIGALTLAPFAVVAGVSVPVRPDTVALLLHLGVITTAVAYALFYAGLRTTPGSVAAVLTLLEPLTAAALAVALLHEPLPLPVIGGGVLLLTAVAATYLTPHRAPRSATSICRLVRRPTIVRCPRRPPSSGRPPSPT